MKTAHVKFKDEQYNYSTSINGTDEEIKDYFVGKWFNLANYKEPMNDNMQQCINVEVE